MQSPVERMVGAFESGQLSRRELIAGLTGLVAAASATGSANAQDTGETSTFKATELNHIALRVADIERSRDFYVKHLGLTVGRESPGSCFLTVGQNNFLALFRGDAPAMDHYCYSVENYDVNGAEAKLKAEGFDPRVVRGDARIYFDDPDGHVVQLAAKDHMPD